VLPGNLNPTTNPSIQTMNINISFSSGQEREFFLPSTPGLFMVLLVS
jgi:hypothetical protein